MDSSGYKTRFNPPKERNVGGTHGLCTFPAQQRPPGGELTTPG